MPEREPKKTEDRRVKRTKKALRDCLFQLLDEKSVEDITVKELTAMADINRSTFYFYYKDIEDMIVQIQNEIYAVFERNVIRSATQFITREDFVQYLIRFLTFCKEREKICKFVMNNDPKRYLTDYAVAGFWQLILQWMYDGMKIPPNEMAVFLANVYFYGSRFVLTGRETV